MNTEFQSDTFIPNNFRILSDFQIVLDYISFNKPEVSRKNNRISNDCVIELNKKLSKKLSLDLKQHNQTSYPQINCLFLLLRASGFGVVNLENSRLTLTVDEGLSKQWIKLNETEKYFNLFFTWICNGVPSIIGVEENLIHSFNNLLHFMTAKLLKTNIIEPDIKSLESAKYSVGTHNLALLEMFGFIEISDNSSELSKKWNITEIRITQLGHYVFQTIKNVINQSKDELYYGNVFCDKIKTTLQNHFKNVFKDYRTDFQISDSLEIDNDLIFKVSLGGIWRKIAVPSDYRLDSFCDYLIDCFDFDHTHLYKIIIKNGFGFNETYTHPEVEDSYFGDPNSGDYTLKSLHIKPGTTMNFTYDFGDNWQFEIMCEAVANVKEIKPRIIEKKGNSPEQYE